MCGCASSSRLQCTSKRLGHQAFACSGTSGRSPPSWPVLVKQSRECRGDPHAALCPLQGVSAVAMWKRWRSRHWRAWYHLRSVPLRTADRMPQQLERTSWANDSCEYRCGQTGAARGAAGRDKEGDCPGDSRLADMLSDFDLSHPGPARHCFSLKRNLHLIRQACGRFADHNRGRPQAPQRLHMHSCCVCLASPGAPRSC